ncbi:outer membrane lipoprotein-sorting protein [soil metagenome]
MMIARRSFILAAMAVALPAFVHAAERDAAEIVAAVDALRLPSTGDGGVKTTIRIIDGEGAKRAVDNMTVLVRGESSLVLMLDGDRRGMKFLGTPQGYWLYAPHTRRAIRLTPQMLLRGNTSVGDISRLRFADDYTAAFAAEKSAVVAGRDCWVINLKAKSQAATYATVTLRVAKADNAPVEAEMFVASGRKLKTVQFAAPTLLLGRKALTTITYLDGVDPSKKTVVQLLAVEKSNAPAGMFKPEALPTEF